MSEHSASDSPSLLVASLNDIGRIGVLAIGLLYTVGVLIVNLDLARYGLVSLGLARPEYLMTGALYALLSGLPIAAWDVAAWKHRREMTNARLPLRLLSRVTGIAILLLFLLMILVALGHRGADDKAPKGLLIAGAFVLWINAACLMTVWRTVHEWRSDGTVGDLVFRAIPRASVNAFIYLIFALSLYVIFLFPNLPRQVGGGSKPTVRLVLSGEHDVPWRDLGIPAVGPIVGPAVLLLETDTHYFVTPTEERVRNGAPIGLDKKLVGAVLFATPDSVPVWLRVLDKK